MLSRLVIIELVSDAKILAKRLISTAITSNTLSFTMLSRVASKSISRQSVLRGTTVPMVCASRRTFVQPTNVDRASIVDTPQDHEHLQNEELFTPRADMLGFKLEVPSRAKGTDRAIYLDMQATTPVDPRVLDAMLPYFTDQYGNPHSRTHAYGWEAEKAVDEARKSIADLIGADAKDVIFTSGATESNNMALKGVAHFHKEKRNHIITTQTEHKCVLDSCRKLSEEGFEITYLPVQKNGVIDLDVLRKAIKPTTSLVSIMAVNNETGVIQPLKEIGEIVRQHKGVYFHTDAAQAAGKIPLDVNAMNIDLMSISGHKIYGPKGVGACYVRRRPRVRLEPIISGGGQERGLRSGTLPTPLVVGLGAAARVAKREMAADHAHVTALSKRLIDGINSQVEYVVRNGDLNGYPGCVNLSFSYVEGESLLMALKDIALSSGSACTSASLEPSYVLRALGAAEDMAHSSLRFGMGRFTTEAEVDYVIQKIVGTVNRLRDMSPLWEMVQEGIDINTIDWSQH
ncbi:cysteine desulfurase [Tulasnella sp. 419]|nr:cysteine desulfurase [Tulasnella sp. 419]